MPTNLELATTAELLNALLDRYDAVVISGVQDRNDADGGNGLMLSWRWKGDHHRCLGLACDVQYRVQLQLASITKPADSTGL